MEIFELDYVEDKPLEDIQAVHRWHCLRKITMVGEKSDGPDEE